MSFSSNEEERGANLSERLELVDELVENIPKPLSGELERDGTVRVEEEVEELARRLVRVESIVDVGSKSSVDVSEVELSVEGEEDGICRRREKSTEERNRRR